MPSPLTEDEKKLATAHHEAGHAIVTLMSRFFQLTDPAIVLAPTPDRTAQSGTSPRRQGLPTGLEMSLEHVEISLGGKAGELVFEELSEKKGRRITLHAGSIDGDFAYAEKALKYWNSEEKRDLLLGSARELIEENLEAWEDIAELARQRMGIQDSLSKQEVESLPSVQKALKNKRPL